MNGERVPAVRRRLVLLACVLATCYAPPAGEPEKKRKILAVCVPEPEPLAEMRGRPTGYGLPACTDGQAAAPCSLGARWAVDWPATYSCKCDHDGDCSSMAVGLAHLNSQPRRSSVCVSGRCVWGGT